MQLKRLALGLVMTFMTLMMLLSVALVVGGQSTYAQVGDPPPPSTPPPPPPPPPPTLPPPPTPSPPTPTPTPKPEDKKITICHKDKNTITISESDWPAHKAHGDYKGPCKKKY
jgi:hypothetical protein